MITHRVGNLLEQPDLTHIAHQANLFHTFGSGIAKAIKEKYPRAYEADLKTPYATKSKMGTWSCSEGEPTIFNLYTQSGLGSTDRNTSYDAMDTAFTSLRYHLTQVGRPVKLGVPYRLGCGLAKGNWTVVEALLEEYFSSAPFDLVICRLG